MEIDYFLTNRPHKIMSRELNYQFTVNFWQWGQPKLLKYENQSEDTDEEMDIIQKLISAKDLNVDFDPQTLKKLLNKDFWDPPKIQINQIYLVPLKNRYKDNVWIKAKLIDVRDCGHLSLVSCSTFEPLITTFFELAEPEAPLDRLLRVGQRVLALRSRIRGTGEVKGGRGVPLLGYVVETPSQINRNRYLIIFDDFSFRYVAIKAVWPIYVSHDQSCKTMPNFIALFLKKLGSSQTEIEFKPRDILLVEMEGTNEIVSCQIVNIDCSLLLVWYPKWGSSEWIHKESQKILNK